LYARLVRTISIGARPGWAATLALAFVVAGALATSVRADDKGAATAVVTAQLSLLDQESALNKCLAASPRKNTPCITRAARKLAAVAAQGIAQIKAALDGTEAACVRTVATQELTIHGLWRRGALALANNKRKQAKALIIKSDQVLQAQRRIQPRCFADVLTGP
jgi:hypothetical protein